MKYFLTKRETIRRTEEIQYEIKIPKNIINKTEYANNQVEENNYQSCKTIDIIDSKMINDEIVGLKMKND